MRFTLVVLIFLTQNLKVYSQADTLLGVVDPGPHVVDPYKGNHYFILRSHTGFLIAHRANMLHIPQNHVLGIELNYEKSVSGKKNWHQLYRNATYGWGLFAANVGNKEILGTGYSVFGYLKANMIKNPRRWLPCFKMGTGLGLVSKPFDPDENHKNNAIGSYLNLFLTTQFDLSYYFKNFQAGIGFSFSHFSNGSFRLPNLGINVPGINLSLGYKIGRVKFEQPLELESQERPWHFETYLVSGVKEIQTNKHRLYPSFDLLLRARKAFSAKSGFGGGVDFIYNTSLGDRMKLLNYSNAESLSVFQLGLNISYYQHFDRLSLFITKGYYVISDFVDDGKLYHRFGGSYAINKKWMAYFALKSHWAKADHFEFGLGYRIR